MRKTKEATAESRQKILAEAARLYRQKGFDGVGVADIMEAAGMTHGGFYRHFPSKEALIAEAMAKTFADRATMLEGGAGVDARDLLRSYAEVYLSPGHVAHPELGCPMAAVGGEASHVGGQVAHAFRDGTERLLASLSEALEGQSEGESRAAALRLLSVMVGAVVVARASGDPAFQREVLDAVRDDPAIRQILGAAPAPGHA
jgi:TetR/AcrR family transcriptional repressor of nem operon